jgi:alanine racemase
VTKASGNRTRRTRIADVAREAGVSKTAVSFAFNSPDRLNSETATRIREVADSLGYRPDPVARLMTQARTMSIGILTPRQLAAVFANPFYAEFTVGVGRAAEASGLSVSLISPLHGSLANAVGRAIVDGVVAIGLAADHPEVEEIRRAGLPLVLVDSAALPDVSSIDIDDEGSARAAAEHLLGLGHRDFLVVGFEPPLPAGIPGSEGIFGTRLRGYRAALAAAGIDLPDSRVVFGPADPEGGLAAFERAWEDGLRPTAVLAMSDAMALGVLRAAGRLGLAVPGDLSVVGFDGIELGRYANPPLTTIHQPIARKGEEAVRILLSLVDGQEPARAEHLRLETRLVIRGSSGPVPARRQEVTTAR